MDSFQNISFQKLSEFAESWVFRHVTVNTGQVTLCKTPNFSGFPGHNIFDKSFLNFGILKLTKKSMSGTCSSQFLLYPLNLFVTTSLQLVYLHHSHHFWICISIFKRICILLVSVFVFVLVFVSVFFMWLYPYLYLCLYLFIYLYLYLYLYLHFYLNLYL